MAGCATASPAARSEAPPDGSADAAPSDAAAVRPPDADALWRRAIADWEAGKDARAIQALQRLLAHHPDHLDGQRALAEMLLRAHGIEETVSYMRDRAAAHPGPLGPIFGLAHALARSGDEVLMREARSLLADPVRRGVSAILTEGLAELVAALDEPAVAADLLLQAAAERRRESEFDAELDALLAAARQRHLAGDFDAAERIAADAERQAAVVRSPTGRVRALQALGALSQSRGRLERAEARFADAAEAARTLGHAGPLVTSLVNLAEVRALAHDLPGALSAFDEADAVASGDLAARTRVRRAGVLHAAGRGDEATAVLGDVLAGGGSGDAPDGLADAHALLGRIHLDAGRWAQAVGALAQAVQVLSVAAEAGGESEALTRARLDMADALVDGGQVEDARSLYDAARRDAEGSGADWLARRAVEGGVRCDLRTGTPDDIRLAVDRLQEDDTDPWLLAEAAAALGDAEAALRWAEASVSQDLDVPAADLPVRYALLAGLLVGAGRPLDAFAAYRAGTVAQLRDRLGPALLPRDPALDGLDAQLKAARALLDQDLTPSVRAFWAGRRRALARERAAWSRDLALKDPALASLLVVEAAAAQAPATTADAPLAALLAGEEDTLAFVAAGDVRTVRLPPLTDARAARRFWPTLRAAAPAARRWRLSPPPEHSGFSWHTLPGAPSADRLTFTPPAAPLARPGGTGAAIPAPPDPLDPLTFDPATLLAASLQGRTVRVRAPADPAAGPALDIAIRLCLYAGADEVRVVLPSGREARWVR